MPNAEGLSGLASVRAMARALREQPIGGEGDESRPRARLPEPSRHGADRRRLPPLGAPRPRRAFGRWAVAAAVLVVVGALVWTQKGGRDAASQAPASRAVADSVPGIPDAKPQSAAPAETNRASGPIASGTVQSEVPTLSPAQPARTGGSNAPAATAATTTVPADASRAPRASGMGGVQAAATGPTATPPPAGMTALPTAENPAGGPVSPTSRTAAVANSEPPAVRKTPDAERAAARSEGAVPKAGVQRGSLVITNGMGPSAPAKANGSRSSTVLVLPQSYNAPVEPAVAPPPSEPAASRDPEVACADRTFLTHGRCMVEQCARAESRDHAACDAVRRQEQLDEERRNPRLAG